MYTPARIVAESLAPSISAENQPDAVGSFDSERAEAIRMRSRWIWAASIAVWVASFLWFDLAVFPSRTFAFAVRGPEIVLAAGFLVWLRRPRPLVVLEAAQVVAWALMAAVSAWALSAVPPDKLPAKVASLAISVLVVCPLAAFSWQATAVIGVITVLALSTLRFLGQGSLLTLVLTAVGFGYGVLIVAAAARDRLKRSEYDARVALREANLRLRHEDELRRRLFVNLSHDFRTPLGVIRGEAALLRALGREEEEAAALLRIEGNARSLTDLTDQLLDLARLEAGQLARRPRRCDVSMFARDAAALLERPGAERRVVTRTTDACVALVDPGHLQRILQNLVANGLRHATGVVTVHVTRADERVVVEVSDDGHIPEERRAKIFERFVTFAAEGSTSSGIGLPLARELATLNGGTLVLLPQATTTFRLELPRVEGPADLHADAVEAPDAAGPARAAPPAADHTAPSAKRVLVVEDNEDMAAMLVRVLGATFHVERVGTVAQALASLEHDTPDAVLSDIMLPDGSGYDVLAAIRGRREGETVPVVFASALGEVDERVRGLAAGADDYVAKPFAPEELRRRILSAIERAESRRRALDVQRDALLMEIHDGVSASLSRAAILLADPAPDASSHARDAIKDGLDEVRAITRLLSPRPTDWRTLVGEIRRPMADACRAGGLAFEFDAEEPESATGVPAAIAHTLRRVAREATTNTLKHAHAKRLVCRLTRTPAFALRVEDDGVGLAPDRREGQGLGIMQRRAARLGAVISVRAGATRGTIVEVTFGDG
ncbi:MAG: response regulator [Myxococcales bacterium]|nr:response regulator [Myxococcales bacterium]